MGMYNSSKNSPKTSKILDAPVLYFIPWRVVFKASSISTPARPVFDCSAKTPITIDGHGGKCLNDLMAKGRSLSFNLIKMLLRYPLGTPHYQATYHSSTMCSSSGQNTGTSNCSSGKQRSTPRHLWTLQSSKPLSTATPHPPRSLKKA